MGGVCAPGSHSVLLCPAEMKKEESTFGNAPRTFPLPLLPERRSCTKALTLCRPSLILSRAKAEPASPRSPPAATEGARRRTALTPGLCWAL